VKLDAALLQQLQRVWEAQHAVNGSSDRVASDKSLQLVLAVRRVILALDVQRQPLA
jgi:hypothetical protein